jgi:polysaccharide export outer membrane protein
MGNLLNTIVDGFVSVLKIRSGIWIGYILALLVLSPSAYAQGVTPAVVTPVSSSQNSLLQQPTSADDSGEGRYRIGPGDVLDVRVFNKPQFNREAVRVDPRGMFRMPLIKEEIRAACRTEEELEAEVTRQLKEYIREPQVTVQVKEYQSEPVAVLGAVRAPSRFQLQRRVRLLELLTFVNGPTDNAGRTVQVVHSGPRVNCYNPPQAETNEAAGSQIDYYKLAETLRGEEKANPYVRPGDVISIAIADQVYVIGNVIRPTSISLSEPLTVSRAIAMAGGTAPDTKKSDVHIIRQTPGTTDKKEIVVDLDAVNRHKAEDVVLVTNDIVEVPASGGKRLFRSLLGAVVPSVGQLPIRVIP